MRASVNPVIPTQPQKVWPVMGYEISIKNLSRVVRQLHHWVWRREQLSGDRPGDILPQESYAEGCDRLRGRKCLCIRIANIIRRQFEVSWNISAV